MTQRTADLPRAIPALLRPCPFCGGPAALEPDPWLNESLRITCGSAACQVKPRTEYLLPSFTDELCAAWNGRPAMEDAR